VYISPVFRFCIRAATFSLFSVLIPSVAASFL
jgi:hypothetical protein